MRWALVTALAVAAPVAASGQIDERVADVRDGTVRFSYDTRPDVEICDQGVRIGDSRMHWSSRGRGDRESGCRYGPAEVELRIRDGVVVDVELITDLDAGAAGADDLGPVPPEEAAGYLIRLAELGPRGSAADDAVFPATLANVHELWRDLVRLARDRHVRSDVRKNAVFWLGQEAAEAVSAELEGLAQDRAEDQDVRDAAIFALSQRPDDEAVPLLIDIARTAEPAESRKKAMFWLAQSDDRRVLEFFEEVLLGRVH